MNERRIKDLSIAMEALSRINQLEADLAFVRISNLLNHELNSAEERHVTKPNPNLDDEIPF